MALRKKPAAGNLAKIRERGFSTAFHDLVDDLDDWSGMVAYCQYKEDKKQACEIFSGDSAKLEESLVAAYHKLTPERVRQLKENARARVKTYAQAAVDEAKPEIERERLNRELFKNSRNQFFLGIVASFIAYLGAITPPDFFEWFAKRDAGAQIQELRTDVRHLTQVIAQRYDIKLAAIEPAGAELLPGSSQAIIESSLPAVPEAFQDQAMGMESVAHLERRLDVWRKASHTGDGNEIQGFRKDFCGAWIRFDHFDDHSSRFGWSIGLLLPNFPRSAESTDDLQPLHWQNTVLAGESWRCVVTSKDDVNILLAPERSADEVR